MKFSSSLSSNSSTHMYGCSHPASVAAYLHQYPHLGPHVIQTEESLFSTIAESFLFFNPDQNIYKLPALDPWFPSRNITLKRLQWLYHASRSHSSDIFLCSKESLSQKTLPLEAFERNIINLKVGASIPTENELQDAGYLFTIRVEEVGFFSLRGGFLDIFSPAHPYPIRIESIGDEVKYLYFFDPETQRNLYSIRSASITLAVELEFSGEMRWKAAQKIKNLPVIVQKTKPEHLIKKLAQGLFFPELALWISLFYESPCSALSFFSLSGNSTTLWRGEPSYSSNKTSEKLSKTKEDFNSYLLNQFYMEDLPCVNTSVFLYSLIQNQSHVWPIQLLDRKLSWPSLKDFKNHFIFISFQSESQKEQMQFHLENLGFKTNILSSKERHWNDWKEEQIQTPHTVHLISVALPFHIQTEESLFLRGDYLLGKPVTASMRPQSYFTKAQSLKFSEIKNGDLIVDRINGVGRYKGLKKLTINQVAREFLELEYRNKDKLYVPVTQLSRLFQFKTQMEEFVLDQLGHSQWKKKIAQAKKSIQEMVLELIKLYSIRANIKRPSFKNSSTIENFEKDFPFEETPDQLKAIQDVFKDMQSDHPMNRLIIGDSGYGKTEVAMRAMFKAVENGFQAALLAPTTVLTLQHFENFKKRFSQYPIRIELINRLIPRSKIKSLLKDIQNQKVDIVIGSHRLLSSDIEFKNLGLFVIDEEQRFGVRHKERLSKIKSNIDHIYMSATPIPRTLNMSLSGMKDISAIQTPPKHRLLAQTHITSFQEEKIKRAILNEVQRGGQVIFVHNRVQSLQKMYDQLQFLLPNIKIGMAHGQMKEQDLESRIVQFFEYKYDVLLCTTIIETGMDFERAHTIIINNAHQLGMSQLYQLKGRVGRRAYIQPYCYFIIPENLISEPSVVERFNYLQTCNHHHSGYHIARYDLERRGGGELFGIRQTGHIKNVGYDLYLEMLDNSLQPSKEELEDPDIQLPWAAYIPDFYIPYEKIRLMYYKYLCDLKDISLLKDLEKEWQDSFGPIPEELKNLVGQVMIQHQCRRLKIKELKALGHHLHIIFYDHSLSRKKIQLPEGFSWMNIYHLLSEK